MARRGLLIRNESKPDDWVAAVRARLADAGIELVDRPCGSGEEACRIIAAEGKGEGEGADLVVVAGGDGTLNGAAPALLELGKPLGVLPLGTANDLARTLGLPLDPLAAAEVLAAGRTRRIDLGLANGRPFFNVASLGLAAEVAQTLEGAGKPLGRLSYALAALKVLLRARPFRAAIAAGDRLVRTRSHQIAVGNGRYHGGGVAVREDASIESGRLVLYSLEPGSLWKVVLLAPLFRRGRHVRWRQVRTASARTIEIRTPAPMPVNLDGDLATQTPLRLEELPGAIEVFVPDA